MKKAMCIILATILLLIVQITYAEGVLPSLAETVGIAMPSLGEALQRYPDSEMENEDGSVSELFTNVSEADFNTFSVYLEQQGAELADYHVEGSVLIAEIRVKGASFSLIYNIRNGEAQVIYPVGTFDERMRLAKEEDILKSIKDCNVGNYVTFGVYPQTTEGNDNTPIEWLVLAREGNRILLISRYGLDVRLYNKMYKSSTWESCSLRKWLNNEFLSTAFSEKEKKVILLTDVDNSKVQGYSEYDTDGGNNTQDYIFLLSYHEAFDIYFLDDKARICAPTDYAVANGALTSKISQVDGRPAGWWWLRSPGDLQIRAADVLDSGFRCSHGVDFASIVVRPVLWLDLDSDIF